MVAPTFYNPNEFVAAAAPVGVWQPEPMQNNIQLQQQNNIGSMAEDTSTGYQGISRTFFPLVFVYLIASCRNCWIIVYWFICKICHLWIFMNNSFLEIEQVEYDIVHIIFLVNFDIFILAVIQVCSLILGVWNQLPLQLPVSILHHNISHHKNHQVFYQHVF